MKGAKKTGPEKKNDSDGDDNGPTDALKSQKRSGKPLPPLFPKHPGMPARMELDEREANLVQLSSYMRAYTRSTPYCVSARKKASYIERYQDKYEPPQPVIPLYAYIEPFIVLLPEECVVGKAKRKWKAAKRTLDAENPDAAELYGESEDEEDGEEKSKDEDGESIEGEDEENEDDYEFEHFSDDEAGDDDDGPDEATY